MTKKYRQLLAALIILIGINFLYQFRNSFKYKKTNKLESEIKTDEEVLLLEKIEAVKALKIKERENDSSIRASEELKNLIRESVKEAIKSLGKNKPPSKIHYLDKYPHFLDCKTPYNEWKPHTNRSFKQMPPINYKQESPQAYRSLRITRAIAVYFPIDKIQEFQMELKWLYRSWIFMTSYEPSKWRTDLVVFVDYTNVTFSDANFFLNKLNCTIRNRRTSDKDESMCVVLDYKPIKNRKMQSVPSQLAARKFDYNYFLDELDIFSKEASDFIPFYNLLIKNVNHYPNLDSVLVAFDGHEYFSSAKYDFVFRSDMDTFVTPLFAKWIPNYCNDFYSGKMKISLNRFID
jgi:hypothetical protein